MLDKLFFYLDFPFVRYAIIVGTLISLCSSLLGVTLVLKRYSYIGDGLSHVAFGALAIAAVLKVTNNMLIILPVTVAVAILLLCGSRDSRSGIQIKGDAAIAMVSVGALAIGYLLMNVFSTSANISGDVCTTLFGSTSILTLRVEEVYLCVALSIAVLAVFILFYHKIFAITFDENFAQATGVNTTIFNLLIAVIVAVIIVLAMNLVGALLVSALVVFPSLSAMRVFKSFFAVVLTLAPSKQADSKTTVVVSSIIPLYSPPITPATATGLFASAITSISLESSLSIPSRVVIFSPCCAFLMLIAFPST